VLIGILEQAAFQSARVNGSPISERDAEMAPVEVFNRQLALDRLEGNELLWGQLVRLFVDEEAGLRREISRTLDHREFRRLVIAAHRLKGFMSNFAATKAVILAEQLEQAAQCEDLAAARDTVPPLELAIAELLAALTAEIPSELASRS
jgi:HPt (histidine-containing phosphotransfer) domain-containing protein